MNFLPFLYNWGIVLVIGVILAYFWGDFRSVVAGIVGMVIGLVITYLVSLVIPTENLLWSMLAVGDASFFAGFFGHWGGLRRRD